jgi:hypothetical protein
MNHRHQILDDKDFWLRLEFDMSGRLSESPDKNRRRYWIDGFIPQSISDTRDGVEVTGEVWVAEHAGGQTKCRFMATVPQRLLHRTIQDFDYEIVALDVERKLVELSIKKGKPNKPDAGDGV